MNKLITWIAAHMGLSAVTDFQLHFFTAATAALLIGSRWPTLRVGGAVGFVTFFAAKELWFNPTFKNSNEPLRVGLRDFSYYTAGVVAALLWQLV